MPAQYIQTVHYVSILGVLLSSSNRITYLESALEMSQLGPVATTIMLGMTPETFPVLIHCGQSSPGMWHCPSQSVCGGLWWLCFCWPERPLYCLLSHKTSAIWASGMLITCRQAPGERWLS